MQKQTKATLIRLIHGYFATWTIGHLFGLLFLGLVLCGKVRVRGYSNLIWSTMSGGGLIIAPNHPTMAETLLLPGIFYPWMLLLPRMFVWSVPRDGLIPQKLQKILRCIEVDRSSSKRVKNGKALRAITHALDDGGIVIIHPEEGRTINGTTCIGGDRGSRKMRRITKDTVPAIAAHTSARILSCWVEIKNVETPMGLLESFGHVWRHGCTLHFRRAPYCVERNYDAEIERFRLEIMILAS